MIPKTAPVRRILIIEEEQDTRDVIEGLLNSDGYLVYAARSEDDAVEKAAWHRPDVILVSLPGTEEFLITIARRVRASADLTANVPVVIFSASSIPEGAEQGIGENIWLLRPDNFNQVRAVLTRVLQGASRTH